MSNSLNSYSNTDSDISKRIIQRLRQGKIDNRIHEILKQVFEEELDKEHIVLSQPEKTRLFRQSINVLLTDLLVKIDGDK